MLQLICYSLTCLLSSHHQCVLASGGTSLLCGAAVNVTNNKKSEITSKVLPPFTFINGVLGTRYNEIVANWGLQLVAQETLDNSRAFAALASSSIAVSVSSRFVAAMGADLTAPITAAFIASSIGVPASSVLGLQVGSV